MKAVACLVGLCLLAGLVSADHGWETGKEYKYLVRGRVMTGISEIANQFAGLQLEYQALIAPKSQEVINIRVNNLRVLEVQNQRLSQGWRETPFDQQNEVAIDKHVRRLLVSPMDVTLNSGVVRSIKVEDNLPTWALNVKKAMASVWTLDITGKNARDANQQTGVYFETVEQTVHGECETTYTVNRNQPFAYPYHFQKDQQPPTPSVSEESIEKPWPQVFNELCQKNDKAYEIIKMVNFTACNEKPVLAYATPAQVNYLPGDNAGGSLWQRALVSRYLACGPSRRNFTILKVTQQERFYTGLQNVEKVTAGVQNNLTLISIQSASNHGEINNPTTIENLAYVFDPTEQRERANIRRNTARLHARQTHHANRNAQYESESSAEQNQDQQEQQQTLAQPTLAQAPLNPLMLPAISKDDIVTRVNELMQGLVRNLTRPTEAKGDSIANRELLSTISAIVKGVRFLDEPQIQQLAKDWIGDKNDDDVGRNIFVDVLAIAGTNPAVNFLLEAIKTEVLAQGKATHTLSSLSLYIRTPTKDLIKQYFSLFHVQSVQHQQEVYTAAMLSFSTLVNNACINKRKAHSHYPVALYGEFCDEQWVAQEFVPYFITKLDDLLSKTHKGQESNHQIFTNLAALGNIGHPQIIPVVQKILENEPNTAIKVKAIHAIRNLIQARPTLNQKPNQQEGDQAQKSVDILTDEVIQKKVLPLLISTSLNHGENPEVRGAALALLLHCPNANIAIWQQIALSTWFEPSVQMRSIVLSSLKGFAEIQRPITPLGWTQQHKARSVLPLVRNVDASILNSHNHHYASFDEESNTGSGNTLRYFQTEDSIIPSSLYYKNVLTYGNGAARLIPTETTFTGQTIQRLIDAFLAELHRGKSPPEQNPDLENIDRVLNIKSRQFENLTVASLSMTTREEIQQLWTIHADSVRQLAHNLLLASNVPKFGPTYSNSQKVAQLADVLHSMPTVLGIPLVSHHRMPSLVSLQVVTRLQNTQTSGFTFQADVNAIMATKIHTELSFKSPFTGAKYQAGVQRHFVVEAPFSVLVRKAPSGKLELAFTPGFKADGKTPRGSIDLVTYHQTPYTAVIKDEFLPIFYNKAGQMKIVHSHNKGLENQEQKRPYEAVSFGEEGLGLNFTLLERSDIEAEQGEESVLSGLMRLAKEATLGSTPIRYEDRKIVLDVSNSATKTLLFQVAIYADRVSFGQLKSAPGSSQEVSSEDVSTSSAESSETSSEKPHGHKNPKQLRHPRLPYKARKPESQSQSKESDERNTKTHEFLGLLNPSKWFSSFSFSHAKKADGAVIAIALLGKADPLVNVTEIDAIQEQKPLLPNTRKTIQYLTELSLNMLGESFARFSFSGACEGGIKLLQNKYPKSPALEDIRRMILGGKLATKGFFNQGCIQVHSKLDLSNVASLDDIAIRRGTLIKDNLRTSLDVQIRASTSCKTINWRILSKSGSITATFSRDQQMKYWAQSKSPEAQKCKQDEEKKFEISPVCLEVAEQQAAALNKMAFNVDISSFTSEDYSSPIVSALKTLYFQNLAEDFSGNNRTSNGHYALNLHVSPNKQLVTAGIRTPSTAFTLKNMETNTVAQTILPLTATKSVFSNVKDRLLRSQSNPSCSIQNNWVSTLDNVTYSFQNNNTLGCQHVLVKDCSGRNPMAVLINNLNQESGRVVTVLLKGQTRIELVPRGEQSASGMRVLVNGHQVNLPHTLPNGLAVLKKMNAGGVQLQSGLVQVASDGERVIVYTVNANRNRTCGLCGDFNNEKVAEMRSPKDIPLSSGTLLVASYAFQGQGQGQGQEQQCHPNEQILKQVHMEESYYSENANARGSLKNSRRESNEYGQSSSSESKEQSSESSLENRKPQFKDPSYWKTIKPSDPGSAEQHFMARGNRNLETSQSEESYSRIKSPGRYTIYPAEGDRRTLLDSILEEDRVHHLPKGSWQQQQLRGSSNISFRQRYFNHPQKPNQVCFTRDKVAVCEEGYVAKKMVQAAKKCYCLDNDQQTRDMKRQVNNNEFIEFENEDLEPLRVAIAAVCE